MNENNTINIRGVIGQEADVSLASVIASVKALGEVDSLVVMIDSVGGEVEEGFAIYDYLRSLGVPITTRTDGACASIATVVFLAGDTRVASGELMIHAPWMEVAGNAEELKAYADEVSRVQSRLEKFYAEKTGLPQETIHALIQRDRYLPAEEAVSLGFATAVNRPVSALAFIRKPILNHNEKEEMNEKEKNIFKKALKALGLTFGKEEGALAMEITDVDGNVLVVEREEGEIAVGDAASPDGNYTLNDGTVIVVVDGVIAEINKKEEEAEVPEDIEALKAEFENQLNALKEEMQALQSQQKTEEEQNILNVVAEMGGLDGLRQICSQAMNLQREQKKTVQPAPSRLAQALEEKRAEKKEKMNLKKNK